MHPIKEAADFLGCYFNDDGVNIQQEGVLTMSREARFLFETAHEFAPDVLINLHGGDNTPGMLIDSSLAPQKLRNEALKLDERVFAAFAKEGFRYIIYPKTNSTDVNFKAQGLTGMLHLCCGGLSMSYESNQAIDMGPDSTNNYTLTFEQIYRTHMLMFREAMDYTCEIFEEHRQW